MSAPAQEAKTINGNLNKRIFPLLLVNFIGALGYSVILPFLVYLITDFGGNAVIYGVIGAVYPLFQFIGAPILGTWSDRVGRKRILLLSQAGTFISWMVFLVAFAMPQKDVLSFTTNSYGVIAFTLPIIVLLIARAFDGLTGGNISVANAYLSDITEGEEREAGYGKMAASMNLGFIIGPVISGVVSSLPNGKLWTVVLSALISFAGIFIIRFMLPETQQKECDEDNKGSFTKRLFNREHKESYHRPGEELPKESIFKIPYVPFFIVMYFGIFLAFNFFYASFPMYAAEVMKWTPSTLGIFFTVLSGVMIFVQSIVLPWLTKRVANIWLFIVGNILLIVCFALMTTESLLLTYVAAALFGMGNGISWPSFLGMLSRVGDKKQQGAIQGFAGSAGSLASIIGMLSGGFIYSQLGGQIFYLSAGGLLIIAIAGLALPRGEKR